MWCLVTSKMKMWNCEVIESKYNTSSTQKYKIPLKFEFLLCFYVQHPEFPGSLKQFGGKRNKEF